MKYDLEDRTTVFAKKVIKLCKKLSLNAINDRLIRQVIGSAGSIGANYREANDALGKKDFINRVRIARREGKETIHWLECLTEANPYQEAFIILLIKEATEIKNILSKIIINVSSKSSSFDI